MERNNGQPMDSVDLDPKPGDILSVWGLDVIEQNIEKFIHLGGLPAGKWRGLGEG